MRGGHDVEDRVPQRLVRAVAAAIFLQWAGNNAMLPLLPLDLRGRGGSDAVVGAVMAAYFAAAVVAQYPAGRLADRVGRFPVLVAGQGAYAAGALLFLAPAAPALDVAFRALQGAGAGGAEVAALAMVARAVPVARRGRAFGTVYGAGLGGMAVGPLLGSLAGTGSIRIVFAAAAGAALLACVPVLATARATAPAATTALLAAAPRPRRSGAAPRPPRRSRLHRSLVGALLAASVVGLTSGLYEACWTLLLHRRGAADWQVGLSWTLYALPYAAMSRPAGWLADHLDRRRLATVALVWVVVCCAGYPFLPDVSSLLALAVGESIGFVVTLPAAQSLLAERIEPTETGRVQGLFAASQTGSTAVAAAGTGALFAVAPWLPFEVVAACCLALLVTMAVVWRPVAGRVVQRRPGEGRLTGRPPPPAERATSRTAPDGGAVPSTVGGGRGDRGEGPDVSTR